MTFSGITFILREKGLKSLRGFYMPSGTNIHHLLIWKTPFNQTASILLSREASAGEPVVFCDELAEGGFDGVDGELFDDQVGAVGDFVVEPEQLRGAAVEPGFAPDVEADAIAVFEFDDRVAELIFHVLFPGAVCDGFQFYPDLKGPVL